MSNETRVNHEIRAGKVRVIGKDGEQIGVMNLEDALKEAEEQDLDLVEVAPDADPVVAKILDYGKYKYKQKKKKQNQQKKKKLKTIKFSIKIEEHDFNTKVGHIKKFLKEGHKVRATVFFRGREKAHKDKGYDLLNDIIDEVEEVGAVDQKPTQKGQVVQMLLKPGGD
ncbi:MAG: translation initiation factor IF-3 [Candidatus Bipolaricaulota bacterium]